MENILIYKIFYLTGWTNPRIHFTFGGKGKWGNELLKRDQRKRNLYFFEVNANESVEFVFCNENKGSWDNNYSKNYKIKEIGGDFIIFKNTMTPINSASNGKSFVFSIDLDGTLLGDGLALKDFEVCWLKNCFFDLTKLLVYNTGRNFKSAVGILNEHLALFPDVFITSCGTGIYIYNPTTQDYEIEETWRQFQAVKFPSKEIQVSLKKYSSWLKDMNFNDSRISFTAKLQDLDKNLDNLLEIKNIYADKRLDVLISGSGEYRYIDLLSSEGGKGKALKHLIKCLKMDSSASYAFGDSMNDTDMLEIADFGVVVSNVQEDLMRYIKNKNLANIELSPHSHANAIFHKLKDLLSI